MKKIILTLLLSLAIFGVSAQEKGLYLTAGVGLGANHFCYTLDNDNVSTPRLGFGGSLGIQYFFTKHWGLATGVGLSFYNSQGNYSNTYTNDASHYSFNDMYDDDFRNEGNGNDIYTLRLGLDNWTEIQRGYFLEIPLLLMYQTKWGEKENWGMYFGIGAKVQIPVFGEEYEVKNGSELSVSALYDKPYVIFPDPNGPTLNQHGYGKNTKLDYEGELNVKTGFAATAEIGLLKTLSRRVDLTLGAYFDYGFTDIKDGNKTEEGYLICPENGSKTIHPSDYVGDNLQYNGYINSHAVDKVNLLAIGGKIGIRVKLGKLSEKVKEEDTVAVIPEKSREKDTVYHIHVYPIDTNRHEPVQQAAVAIPTERLQPKDDELRILLEPIFFDLDKDKLLPASILILNRKAAILERYPKMQLLITGNTCDLASDTYNLKLGERRAKASQKYLEDLGINRGRLSIVSQSFHHPMKPNLDESNREKNRRCDFYPTGY